MWLDTTCSAPLAQLAERRSHNAEIVSPILTGSRLYFALPYTYLLSTTHQQYASCDYDYGYAYTHVDNIIQIRDLTKTTQDTPKIISHTLQTTLHTLPRKDLDLVASPRGTL